MDNIHKEIDALERILYGSAKPSNLRLPLLQYITENFSVDQKIGHGGFGEVYKGTLRNGIVAVKKLFSNWTIEDKLFNREVQTLTRVKHQNIVRFLGYCANTEHKAIDINGIFHFAEIRERLLCFEYIHKGSLENYLSDELRGHEWCTRYQIINGICAGLDHLHNEAHIIHMDLKPANILLDDQLMPKITDFGLSRLDEASRTKSADRFFTLGYCAPEYLLGSKKSVKLDIYSLGVIIIELVTGRKDKPNITSVLRRWRHRWNKSANYTPLGYQQVAKCIELAIRCMDQDPLQRPFVWDIINALNQMENQSSSEYTIDQFSCLEDMLGIEPLELHFPFEPNKQITCSLKLTNDTEDYIAFSIQIMSPLLFCAQPNKDVVSPRSMCSVTITLQAQEKVPEHKHFLDGFDVQSTRVDEGLTAIDITEDVFNGKMGKAVDKVNFTAVFDAPPSPEEPIHDLPVTAQVLPVEGWRKFEEATKASGEGQFSGHMVSIGSSSQANPETNELLVIHPLELHFPLELNKLVPCSMDLTTNTAEHVAFDLVEGRGQSECFARLPLRGIVPPRSTYTLVLTSKMLEKPPERQDFHLILQASVVGDKHIHPFKGQPECDQFFTEAKEMGKLVCQVTLKAVCGQQAEPTSELVQPGIKISSVDNPRGILDSLDTNPVKHLTITGHSSGYVRIWNYKEQKLVGSVKVSKEKVSSVKFIARKQWFVALSHDGFINVYNYGTKKNLARFKADDYFITSLAVHPTHPYVLSTGNDSPIKLWDWEKQWECRQAFEREHYSLVRQVAFNPVDTNSFVSAADDHTIKVWNLASPYSDYTLSGHSAGVNCLDYFTCGDQQYLISGSDDQTAKLNEMEFLKTFGGDAEMISRHFITIQL